MIPLAKDTRKCIGSFSEGVENRSLLFEKMVLTKTWGHEARFSDANRFNVLRATTHGRKLLAEDRDAAQREAQKAREKDNNQRADAEAYKAKVAGALAAGKDLDATRLAQRQVENANHFLASLETAYSGSVRTFVGSLGGRLLINMAGGVMENAGLAIDRCFGLPFIPGSAVKGVTRNAALWDVRKTENREEKVRKLTQALLIFGYIEQDLGRRGHFLWAVDGQSALLDQALSEIGKHKVFKGLLAFLEAKPTDTENLHVVAEVITPHPRGGEPRPLFFPAVEAGSCFGFALLIQRKFRNLDAAPLLDVAESWLKQALTKNGLGAKTGAGYGWFEIDPVAEEKRRAQMERDKEAQAEQKRKRQETELAQAKEQERLAGLSPTDLAKEEIIKMDDPTFADFAKSLGEKDEIQQQAFLEVLQGKDYKTKRKNWQKRKPEIWNSIQAVANKLNIQI